MTTKEIAELLHNAGLKIYQAYDTFFWKNNFINYTFPPVYKISFNTIKKLKHLSLKHLITVMYSDTRIKNTNEFILQTDNYNLESFNRKVRNRLRKSIQSCAFKKPQLTDLYQYGLMINCQTCERQHRSERYLTDKVKWERFISTIYYHDDFTILGAYFQDRMVGYIAAYTLMEKQIILLAYIDRNDSEISCPMNGLIFSLVNLLIEKFGTVNLSYGIESFVPIPELNRFKTNMLFTRISGSRVYLLNPFLVPVLWCLVFFVIVLLKRKNVHSSFMQKAIRLYQGYRLYYKAKRYAHL